MSDYFRSYRNFTDFLSNSQSYNYESFKQILYGSCGEDFTEINHGEESEERTREKRDSKTLSYNNENTQEAREHSCAESGMPRHQDLKGSSHIEVLEKLSFSLVRLLGEVKKEYHELQNRTSVPVQHQCFLQLPKRRLEEGITGSSRNYAEVQSIINYPVVTTSNMTVQAHNDTATQTKPRSLESNTSSLLESRKWVELPQQYNSARRQAEKRSGKASSGPWSNFSAVQSNTNCNTIVKSHDDNVAQVILDNPNYIGLECSATHLSEVENIINDFQDDNNLDRDLSSIEQSLIEGQATNPASFDDCSTPVRGAVQPKRLSPWHATVLDKELRKKYNHNMIEKRRRFNMNDRIKELETLLPCHTDTKIRQKKGTVLKSSVEYIKTLKKDQERLQKMEEKNKTK